MLLTIDVGNTNITFGLFAEARSSLLQGSWRIGTERKRTADEYAIILLEMIHRAGFEPLAVTGVVIASVVPDLDHVMDEVVKRCFRQKPLFVSSTVKMGIKIRVDDPSEVGADRFCNAEAAFGLYKRAAVVVDFGTATTFDCITARGEYVGGVIAPGPQLAAEALARGTAKLPRVDFLPVRRAIGRNTVDCLQAGLYYGYLGLISEILKQVRKEMKGRPIVIATGGLAGHLSPRRRLFDRQVPDLTLQGLRMIGLRNKKRT